MANVRMRWYDTLAILLLSIGGIEWLLYGATSLFNKRFTLLSYLFGDSGIAGLVNASWLGFLIQIIVGFAGAYSLIFLIRILIEKIR